MGTLDYIAPEQAMDSHDVDIRADLYSLGCTLYFLLTGKAPFPGGEALQKLLKHRLEEPVPVEQLRPDVPPGVAAVVRKLMAKRPEDRYQTPAEAAAARLGRRPGRADGAGGVYLGNAGRHGRPWSDGRRHCGLVLGGRRPEYGPTCRRAAAPASDGAGSALGLARRGHRRRGPGTGADGAVPVPAARVESASSGRPSAAARRPARRSPGGPGRDHQQHRHEVEAHPAGHVHDGFAQGRGRPLRQRGAATRGGDHQGVLHGRLPGDEGASSPPSSRTTATRPKRRRTARRSNRMAGGTRIHCGIQATTRRTTIRWWRCPGTTRRRSAPG